MEPALEALPPKFNLSLLVNWIKQNATVTEENNAYLCEHDIDVINKLKKIWQCFIQDTKILSLLHSWNFLYLKSVVKFNRVCWKLPYLICYQKLAIEENIKKQFFDALLEYATNNIEYIHEVDARHRFFKQTDHNYINFWKDFLNVIGRSRRTRALVPGNPLQA